MLGESKWGQRMSRREILPLVYSDMTLRAACQRAWDAVDGLGQVLPQVRLAGGRAWPVVRWHEVAVRDRLLRRAFAVVDRVVVRDWVAASAGEVVPLTVEGFVFTGEFARVRSAMTTLAPLGRMVWLSSGGDDWSSWACELGGFWAVDPVSYCVVTHGEVRPELPGEVGAVGRRLLVEQLFELAAREECLPVLG